MGIRHTTARKRWSAAILCLALGAPVVTGHPDPRHAAPAEPAAPAQPWMERLDPIARRLVEAPYLTEQERAEKRIFFGVWEADDLITPHRQAEAALRTWDLTAPILLERAEADEPMRRLRAQAALHRGECDLALEYVEGLDDVASARIRAEALWWLGRHEESREVVDAVRDQWITGAFESAPDLTEAARCLSLRARLRGLGAAEYQTIMGILAEVGQRIDRTYWPAKLAEAEVLVEKSNRQEAGEALQEVLSLNPRCSEAWYLLGRLTAESYNFEAADSVVASLNEIHPQHPLARLITARSALVQGFARQADGEVTAVVRAFPQQREALALRAAVQAAYFDEDGLWVALDDFDRLSPGLAYAHYTAGVQLSRDRQYGQSADVLGEAIRREPTWPAPQTELGLMELQSGRDDEALRVLRQVIAMDRFNARALFSLRLLEDLQNYETVESEHFLVRYDPETSDRALAVEMLPYLERIHEDITEAFAHDPGRPTTIELMPNHERFGVRITGMPQIHTIAASTGPVIAMESPRNGPGHWGTYDWERTLRHEYVHTVTLSQTNYRIPHWFTEAAAVWAEDRPRDYTTVMMLTEAWRAGRLFDLDAINWAFVRPERPEDRPLAYAQGHWMFEFLIERYGREAMLALMDQYALGFPEELAIPEALNVSRTEFFEQFSAWATEQVRSWGMDPQPSLADLIHSHREELAMTSPEYAEAARSRAELMGEVVRQAMLQPMDRPRRLVADFFSRLPHPALPEPRVTDETLQTWSERYPDQPDVLLERIKALKGEQPIVPAEALPLIERYLALRPVDVTPHRWLAAYHLDAGDAAAAIESLAELDLREQSTGIFAIEMARQHRNGSRYAEALADAERALLIEPFNAAYREFAATVAIQAGEIRAARRHLEALALIEPDRPQHQRRLEALSKLESSG